jgi:hypothetical protein
MRAMMMMMEAVRTSETRLHDATSQKALIIILAAMRTRNVKNLKNINYSCLED